MPATSVGYGLAKAGTMDAFVGISNTLREQGEPFATAVVVRCESPTSAKPGAKAVVKQDGTIIGWIGGGCAQPIVAEQAQEAIRQGAPRLIRITPDHGLVELPGMMNFEMACHSGGTLDIFIEPVLPPLRLLVLGRSPVAQALSRLGSVLGYAVTVHAPGAAAAEFPDAEALQDTLDLSGTKRPEQSFVVVSSQGEYDEDALEAALSLPAPYLAFVASKTKWEAIRKYLAERGCKNEQLERVRVPAGLSIQAVEPGEIALSILAEIVSLRRAGALAPPEAPAASAAVETDPICKMKVKVEGARHVAEHKGRKYYFCCAACKQAFKKSPAKFAKAS